MTDWRRYHAFLNAQKRVQGERGTLTDEDVSQLAGFSGEPTQEEVTDERRPGDELVVPDKPKGKEHVLRCDDSWERSPNGTIRLVRKNCRWEIL